RYFYLPPPGETRLVRHEVVLALPCEVSQPQLDAVTRRLGLTVLGSQCLGTGTTGTAVYRMQSAGGQTPPSAIRALVSDRILPAAPPGHRAQRAAACDPCLLENDGEGRKHHLPPHQGPELCGEQRRAHRQQELRRPERPFPRARARGRLRQGRGPDRGGGECR